MPYIQLSMLCLAVLLHVIGDPALAWEADMRDGDYKNPVLFADYSDPDVVRVGADFYMTSSSFNCVPGLPILHSRDLVHWRLIGHAVQQLPPAFDEAQHGNGIWAPSLRYHDGWFWIFVGDPDRGIYMTKTQDPAGPWEPLHLLKPGKGLIDPCPLWDDDGKAYLAHAFAKSRAGKNSIVVVQELAPVGDHVMGEERIVIDGRDGKHPTIEGPKFYKRDGWYYILAPAGGVEFGWQLAARAKDVWGPYKVKRVMEQGGTDINGPHQGAWVSLESGEDWFVHFQEVGAYGRLVHLNPMKWADGWPLIGVNQNGDGVGEPVRTHRKPTVGAAAEEYQLQTSDEFDSKALGLQWQWHGNPRPEWSSLSARPGWLRLNAVDRPADDLSDITSHLLQKLPAPEFTTTTELELAAPDESCRAGLVVLGLSYSGLFVTREGDGLRVELIRGKQEERSKPDKVLESVRLDDGKVQLRVAVSSGAVCQYSYSRDGVEFIPIGSSIQAAEGRWIGAKVGLTCLGAAGHADVAWFRIDAE